MARPSSAKYIRLTDRIVVGALLLLCALSLVAIAFGPGPDQVDLDAALASAGARFWLGSDPLGRDLAARLSRALWRSIAVFATVGFSAIPLGLAAGLLLATAHGIVRRGAFFLLRISTATPPFIVALAVVSVLGLTPFSAGLALGLAHASQYALTVATRAQQTLAEPYVKAAQALGVGRIGIVWRHVLPDVWPMMRCVFGADAGRAIMGYAALAFIGLGADTGAPDLGAMVFEYRGYLLVEPQLIILPVAVTTLLVLALHRLFDRPISRSFVEAGQRRE